jgi:hypothetical protein
VRRRVWAPIGERPLALGHHRYEWLCVTAFIQPTGGETVWYLSDGVSKPFFEKLLADFAETVEAGRRRRIVLHKICGSVPESAKGRYSPAKCIGTEKHRIEGQPEKKHVSTSYVERSNLTIRMQNRRFTRLTNGFSKKLENHAYSVALFVMFYNFTRIHKALRVTPAMQAGVTDRLWEVADIVALVEAEEAKADRTRGPYRKKIPA